MNRVDEIESILQDGGYSLQKSKTVKKYKYSNEVLERFKAAGWSLTFLKSHFQNLNDELLYGWNLEHFVETYAKHLIKNTQTTSISESLIQTGLRKSVAKDAEEKCKSLLVSDTSYTFAQVLDVAIEYVLGKYTPLTNASAHFFLEPEKIFTWIQYESNRILNVPYSCKYEAVKYLQKRLPTLITESPNHKLFFHTTNWSSIKSLYRFINHDYGRPCLDFGYVPGFYLSETLDECVDWGVKQSAHWSSEVAILVFQIPNQLPETLELKHFSDASKEWGHIVQKSRECLHNDKHVYDIDNMFDFIYGPMLANVYRGEYKIRGPKAHTPLRMQLVSKSGKADAFLQKHLQGAIIFKKHNRNVQTD